ncbi:MAG TPA: alpha/beta hydrolase [Nevskiaceae bacterium]|nr:alpha/beta hydrolase [Nevskiaceae bacterium]
MSAPWLLLRGLMRDQRHWGPFLEQFRAAAGGAAVYAVDFAGNGARYQETSPASVAGLVADLRAQLPKARGPWRVFALSLGAMVTVEWARRHPQELHSAVLVNTSLRPYSRVWERLQPRAWPRLLRTLAGGEDATGFEADLLALTSRHPAVDREALLADWVRWHRACPVSRANGLRQLVAAARYRAAPHPPAVPLRLLVGAGDQLVSPRCSERLAAAWRLPLHRHPSAGHDLPLDAPDWVLRQLFS